MLKGDPPLALSDSFPISLYLHTYIVDCNWAAWNEWTPCSVTCGNGTITQERYEEQQSAFGGKPCEGQTIKTEECRITECPGT